MEVHTWVEWEVDWVTIINTYLNRATKNVTTCFKSAIKIEFYVTPAGFTRDMRAPQQSDGQRNV